MWVSWVHLSQSTVAGGWVDDEMFVQSCLSHVDTLHWLTIVSSGDPGMRDVSRASVRLRLMFLTSEDPLHTMMIPQSRINTEIWFNCNCPALCDLPHIICYSLIYWSNIKILVLTSIKRINLIFHLRTLMISVRYFYSPTSTITCKYIDSVNFYKDANNSWDFPAPVMFMMTRYCADDDGTLDSGVKEKIFGEELAENIWLDHLRVCCHSDHNSRLCCSEQRLMMSLDHNQKKTVLI